MFVEVRWTCERRAAKEASENVDFLSINGVVGKPSKGKQNVAFSDINRYKNMKVLFCGAVVVDVSLYVHKPTHDTGEIASMGQRFLKEKKKKYIDKH